MIVDNKLYVTLSCILLLYFFWILLSHVLILNRENNVRFF